MTISIPGSTRFGRLGRKKASVAPLVRPRSSKQLEGEKLARLFDKKARMAKPAKPAKMNETETRERDRLSTLRGALYSEE